MKLALVIQFHPGDRDTAMRLARLIADLEELPRNDVVVHFAARYDTEVDGPTADHVAFKFPVRFFTSQTPWIGWPAGPNGIARDLLLEFEKDTEFDGVLLIEPDCVPLSIHWLNILMSEWHDARIAGKVVMGSWRGSGPAGGHINGNMVFIPQLASWLGSRGFEVAQLPKDLAWDCAISPWLREHWQVTGRIRNDFQSRSATLDVLTPETGDEPVVLLHGYKDDSAYNLARHLTKLDAE